jgi:excisionase family DNA binding protein
METKLMTIRDVAAFMQLSEQTIQRYVLNREIPFHKVKKVIRFRLSEIERWIDEGGGKGAGLPDEKRGGDLFADVEGEQAVAEGRAGGPGGSEATGGSVEVKA